jgi:DNA modification methylase
MELNSTARAGAVQEHPERETFRIICGDALTELRKLPSESVHCCVTSPPYWGLRDYGTAQWEGGDAACDHTLARRNHPDAKQATQAGSSRDSFAGITECRRCGASRVDQQIGLEPTPELYVARLVEVFAEVRRVLRNEGILWLNVGDSYNAHPGQRTIHDKAGYKQTTNRGSTEAASRSTQNLKPKDLVGVPWRVAFALQADGWWLRSDIIWHKPNPMPESVTDRPTKAHEYVFLLAKSERYFYDADAIREVASYPNGPNSPDAIKSPYGQGFTRKATDLRHGRDSEDFRGRAIRNSDLERNGTTRGKTNESCTHPNGRNKRTVWTLATLPTPDAHFACVDAETECLTTEGWKTHANLRLGMYAAQFDVDKQTLSWGKVEDIARYEVSDQEMVRGHCRDLDMILTPNHRCVIQRRHPRTRKHQKPIIIEASAVRPGHAIPTAADWSCGGCDPIDETWAELLGWYIAEGHESKQSAAVEIYQSDTANSPNVRRIEQLLRIVGAEFSLARALRKWRGRDAIGAAFRLTGYAAMRLRELAPSKQMPRGCLTWSQDIIAALVRGLIDGDGHTRLDGRRCFTQKDKRRVDIFQGLILRLGMSATVAFRAGGTWCVYVTSHKTRSFRGTRGVSKGLSRINYSGVIWCPKLPHGTWFARKNGRAFITGNTFPIELPETCMRAGCPEGGLVIDPFAGAGTVGMACIKNNRRFLGIELNPDYVAIAYTRARRHYPLFAPPEPHP